MRAEQLLGGCILAVLLLDVRSGGINRVVLAFLVAVPNKYYSPRNDNGSLSTCYYNGLSTVITLASAIIIGHLTMWPLSSLAKLLSLRPLVSLAQRSYAVYLWHVPLFGLFFLRGQPDLLRSQCGYSSFLQRYLSPGLPSGSSRRRFWTGGRDGHSHNGEADFAQTPSA